MRGGKYYSAIIKELKFYLFFGGLSLNDIAVWSSVQNALCIILLVVFLEFLVSESSDLN